MTHENYGAAFAGRIAHLAQASLLEGAIADSQNLINEEDLGLEKRGDRKGEPDVHPARVVLDRRVDEGCHAGEVDDLRRISELISLRRIPRIAPLRNTFSLPVSSG